MPPMTSFKKGGFNDKVERKLHKNCSKKRPMSPSYVNMSNNLEELESHEI